MGRRTALALALALTSVAGSARALDPVIFGTHWNAAPEHGGFYQAVAAGIDQKCGLEVTIRAGGPQVNHGQLLAAGKIDFNMGGDLFEAFNDVHNDVPMVVVAAIFHKDPQVLMAHPDQGFATLADLGGRPILIAQDARTSLGEGLKAEYGDTDHQPG